MLENIIKEIAKRYKPEFGFNTQKETILNKEVYFTSFTPYVSGPDEWPEQLTAKVIVDLFKDPERVIKHHCELYTIIGKISLDKIYLALLNKNESSCGMVKLIIHIREKEKNRDE